MEQARQIVERLSSGPQKSRMTANIPPRERAGSATEEKEYAKRKVEAESAAQEELTKGRKPKTSRAEERDAQEWRDERELHSRMIFHKV